MAPVALGIEVPQTKFRREAELDAGDAVRDLAGDELEPAQRALVVEEDAGGGVQAEALAVVHRDPMAVEFGDGIGRARIERRRFRLRRLLDLAVHFRGRRLVEARLRAEKADGLQHVGHADRRHVGGENGLLPRGRDEGLRGEIVDLVGPVFGDDAAQARQIADVAIDEPHAVQHAEPFQPMVGDARMRRASHDTGHLVALFQQQPRQIGAVLAGDAGHKSSLRHIVMVSVHGRASRHGASRGRLRASRL